MLLDDEGRDVGFHQIGEIAVRSRYLSPGYWCIPELTQAKFLPDPEGGGQRIYLTGDLGRMLPDGCLEHLGRKDFLVQIRGYKVDVAEIETALLDLPTIEQAVAMAQKDHHGNHRIVAYIVSAQQPPTITELRGFLKGKLPDYMLPASFVILDSLPQTPNGKVDRLALPAPGSGRPDLGNTFVPPRSPVENKLSEIWAAVLGLDQVGIQDNFLDLGGDSLLASQVIARVIKTCKVEVPLRSLWESPTIADMAVIIIQNQAKRVDQEQLDRMLTELEELSSDEA